MRKKGFTIIELLIVIAVISILVGIALPRFRGMQEEGKIAQAKGELRTVQTAVESYYIHNNNTYPSALSDVETAVPLIIDDIPDDPFKPGTAYVYVKAGTPTKYYAIYSVGTAGDGTATVTTDGVASDTSKAIYITNGSPRDTTP